MLAFCILCELVHLVYWIQTRVVKMVYLLMNHQAQVREMLERMLDVWLHSGRSLSDRADLAPFLAVVLLREQTLLH